jgi:hypothetical protein
MRHSLVSLRLGVSSTVCCSAYGIQVARAARASIRVLVPQTKGVAFGNAIGLRELACPCDDFIELHEVSFLGGRSAMGELRCTHDPTLV